MVDLLMVLVVEHLVALAIFAVVLIWKSLWKIPVTILRYTGNKQRPTLITTKARKVGVGWMGAVKRLIVKGYSRPLKDFKAEDYYPSLKGHGGLLLFEFKTGWLTPVIPRKVWAGFSKEEQQRVRDGFALLQRAGIVDFQFDQALYDKLVVEAIDDVDAEYFLREQQRQDAQYAGTWKDFITRNGPWIALVLIGAFMLIGYIIWLDKSPAQAQQCIQAGVEAAKNTYLQDLAGNLSRGGTPLG